MNNLDIAKIVAKVIEDKDANFQLLYAATYSTVYRMAYSYFKNIHDAEDITQEVFVKVYSNINSLNNNKAFNSWLNRIVINTCHHNKKNNINLSVNCLDSELHLNNLIEENEDNIPDKALDKKEFKLLLL